MAEVLGGFQPDTKSPSARRADFDLQRRIANLERNGGGGGELSPTDRWNTAWGVVTKGAFLQTTAPWTIGVNTSVAVASLNATTVVGRRYRLTIFIRAATTNAATHGIVSLTWVGSGFVNAPDCYTYMSPSTMYTNIAHSLLFDGTGQASTYTATLNPTFNGINIWPEGLSYFCLEDIGPVAGATAIPDPTPAWTDLTLTNGWLHEGSSFLRGQYRRVGDVVSLRGTIALVGANPVPSPFTLPVGYRPSKFMRMMVGAHRMNVGGTYFARCDLLSDPDGRFIIYDYTPPMNDPVLYLNMIPPFSVTP